MNCLQFRRTCDSQLPKGITRLPDRVPILEHSMTTEPPKRRWLQFRLRTLLIAVLVLSLPLSWFAWRMEKARKQREAVEVIRGTGGYTIYDAQKPSVPPVLLKVLGCRRQAESVPVCQRWWYRLAGCPAGGKRGRVAGFEFPPGVRRDEPRGLDAQLIAELKGGRIEWPPLGQSP